MPLPFMKLFLWEEVEGTKMTSSSYPSPIIITEGLGVEVEDGKGLETTEVRSRKLRIMRGIRGREESNGRQSV